MSMTRRLLGHLYRPISRDPDADLALDVAYSPAAMSVTVQGGRLTTAVPGDPSAELDIDLEGLRVAQVAALINAAPGYSAAVGSIEAGDRAAITLIDVDAQAGGGALYVYRSLVWAYMHAVGRQLELARDAIADALAELRIDTATGDWLDLWREVTIGGRRLDAESDVALRARIISTMLQLKCNNRALERIVAAQTGITVAVLDIPWYLGDQSMFTHGGRFWASTQVTNSVIARTPPAAAVNSAVVSAFGLNLLPDGRPAYGPTTNRQALVAVFAVVFASTATIIERARVLAIVETFKAAGTTPMAFRPGVGAGQYLPWL